MVKIEINSLLLLLLFSMFLKVVELWLPFIHVDEHFHFHLPFFLSGCSQTNEHSPKLLSFLEWL